MNKIENIIRYHADTYPRYNSMELAKYIKGHEFGINNPINSLSIKDLAKQITAIKRPKEPKVETFYSVNLGCYHIPFHDKAQWEATLYLIGFLASRFTTDVNLVGDMMDMNSISRHGKGKKAKVEGLTLSKEYQEGNKELDKLDLLPLRNKRYFYGNHENWYYVHMSEIDNAKLGEDVIKSPAEGLHLGERGYTVFNDYMNDRFLIGDLWLTHGSYFNTHAAQKHLEAFKQNVLFFHTHRMQSFTDSGQNGTITAYNGGCGVQRNAQAFNYADQASKARWEQGLTVSYTDELNHTHVDMLHWKNERFIYMGHQFTKDGVFPL